MLLLERRPGHLASPWLAPDPEDFLADGRSLGETDESEEVVRAREVARQPSREVLLGQAFSHVRPLYQTCKRQALTTARRDLTMHAFLARHLTGALCAFRPTHLRERR